ncbi:MAG: hypothetical protein GX296_06455 [Bacteroidales bacterium]|jgi:hypothetical protein|nr:hypothetical protein [Bacteroidales bacterium]
MNKKFYSFLILFVLGLFSAQIYSQNLIAGWDGDGVTGENSKPNDVGWLSSVDGVPWSTANSGGGCRFRDPGEDNCVGYTNEDGTENLGRQLMLRWDGSPYNTAVYAYPVELEGNSTYEFSLDFLLGGSSTAPKNMTVGASTTPDLTGQLVAETFTSTDDVKVYRRVSILFTTSTAGTYYVTFTGAWAWYGITNLYLEKSDVQLTELNKQYEDLDLGDLMGIIEDIDLPTELGTQGVTVAWSSSNPAVIDSTGKVTQPEKYNAVVKLTATVSQQVGDSVYSLVKIFNAMVEGIIPTPDEVAQWDFNPESISLVEGVTQVTDNFSGFVGTLKNEARIRTIGETDQYNVLDLGNGTGYFDMGEEIGKVVYSLLDYTLCGYFRIDEDYAYINNNGNFYWTFSNSADIDADKNGYMIGSLKAQSQSVATNYYNIGNQATSAGANAPLGAWHHFAFVQSGNVGIIYLDGVEVARNESMTNLPAFAIPKEGFTGTLYNWLGRSNYKNDVYLRKALLYDFRMFAVPLSVDDINLDYLSVPATLDLLNNAYAENPDYIADDLQVESDNLDPGDLSAVTADLTLPSQGTTNPDITIVWKSSNTQLITNEGLVTRPDFFDYSLTLTATLIKDGQSVSKDFEATVLAKEGTAFQNDLMVHFDFSEIDENGHVVDQAEKGFKGVSRNGACVGKIGTSTVYNVLHLGDSIGYFDMGEDVGKVIYNLTDYTICAYFRVDEVYEELTRNGNFLWAFSNSEDIRSDALGYIICPLNNQRHSITLDGSGANQQTVSAGYAPLQGTWHHIAYVQDSELQTGTLYLDGVPVALGEITHLPKFALPREGKLGTPYNWIGRSCYSGDAYLRHTLVYDFRIYGKALTDDDFGLGGEMDVTETIVNLDAAYEEFYDGLSSISFSPYKVYSVNGSIIIDGLNGNEQVAIYNVSGQRVKMSDQSSAISVRPGIYVVRIGDFASKVIVR